MSFSAADRALGRATKPSRVKRDTTALNGLRGILGECATSGVVKEELGLEDEAVLKKCK